MKLVSVCVSCLIAQVHNGCRCRPRSAAKCLEATSACIICMLKSYFHDGIMYDIQLPLIK